MRSTFYETGTLFPGRIGLGGGTNIYNFSYYGYLRPDILLGCALPGVSMELILTLYCAAGYIASALLFWLLLGKCADLSGNPLGGRLRFWGAVIFLSAGCFFQVHRQIVFVNYMPFLLGAMLAALPQKGRFRTGSAPFRRLLLILMLTLIIFHSYYFAIPCLLSVYLFLLHAHREYIRGLRSWFFLSLRYAGCALCSVLLSGVLLLPSAAAILNCVSSKDGGSAAAADPFALRPDFSGFLYSPYGYGLTLVPLFLLLSCLCVRGVRLLCGFLLFGCICGVLPYALNGFLYARSKILIPFLPLVILAAVLALRALWSAGRSAPFAALPICAYAAYLQYGKRHEAWVFFDLAVTALLAAALFWKRMRRTDRPCFASRALSLLLGAAAACSWCFSLFLHCGEEYLPRERTQISQFTDEERRALCEEEGWRFDSFLEPYQTVNREALPGAERTSMYTSTPNPLYSSFYFDVMRNPIRINNRVALLSQANPFFQYLMGVRYLECSKAALPCGYEVRAEGESSVLAENENVLPLCYGSTALLSEEAFDNLAFPETLEALTSRSVVSAEAAQTDFSSRFEELFPEEGRDYRIERHSDRRFDVIPSSPVRRKILVLTFDVRRLSSEAASVTINGIRNKLSGAGAPYPNGNTAFTFVLSSPEEMDRFSVSVSGKFEISDIRLYALDTRYFGMESVYPLKEGGCQGDEVVNGSVALPKDGYLITSLPLEPGFTAFVDGEECEISAVNKAFAGVPLSAGEHTVRILYRPPLFNAGAVCSLAGCAVFLSLAAADIRRRHIRKETELL